jgi:pyruvate dehydrogenase phosphatase
MSSNSPCEDEVVQATFSVPSGRWSFFGVYDGHSGWDTAVYLREHLVAAVSGALADLYHSLLPTSPSPEDARPEPSTEDVEKTLKSTFEEVDDDLVHGALERVLASSNPRTAATRALGPAYSGACALLAFYDSHSRLLHVAVTGDSRAVLGRRIAAPNEHDPPSYEVHVLSVDQDGHNAAEATRLEAEHPGEAVVRNGRVLGMGPARAFGDARYKWPRDVQETLKRDHLGRSPIREVKTPPYLTAEPEVIAVHVQPGDFLVLASDGLWEALNNEDAVGLVGWWLQTQDRRLGTAQDKVVLPENLPVCRRQDEELQRSARYGQWSASKRFVVEDDNAATHLIRNALGGANSDLLNALLLIPAPRSRVYRYEGAFVMIGLTKHYWYRDDITATVVFFDDTAEPPS